MDRRRRRPAPPPAATTTGLTVAELRARREAGAAVNHETYKGLLAQAEDRVRAREAGGFSDLLWQVPPMVPGRPVYAVSHAARYVGEKLRRGGFAVADVASPDDKNVHVLYVTWNTRKPVKAADKPGSKPAKSPNKPAGVAGLPASVAEATHRLERLKARLRF